METANTEKKGINKNLIIIIAAVAVAIIALVVGGIFIFGEKTYRVLKIYQVEGQASVVHNDGSEVTPYENMLLQSGDQISLVEGTLIIRADEDKYIYLENNTTIILEADGTAADSRTSIQLLQGAVINQIEEPLSSKSVYELNTQNATMSVRGTIYRVEVTVSANGEIVTDAQALEGEIETDLLNDDGTPKDDKMRLIAGKCVQIYSDTHFTYYVGGIQDIDVDTFSNQTYFYLNWIRENSNKEMSVSDDAIDQGLNEDPGPFEVTFKNGNDVFGTVIVEKGKTVGEPLLMPTAKGHWEFDFANTPIKEDTEIKWVAE